MEDALRNFEKRQKSVRRKHVRMANGYVTKLDRNGVFVQTPDNKATGFGMRLLMLLVIGFMGFKLLLLTYLGEDSYLETWRQLQGETLFERAGAWLMQPDAFTVTLAKVLAQYLS